MNMGTGRRTLEPWTDLDSLRLTSEVRIGTGEFRYRRVESYLCYCLYLLHLGRSTAAEAGRRARERRDARGALARDETREARCDRRNYRNATL